WQLAATAEILDQQLAQVAEWTVEDQRLHPRFARRPEQRDDRAHRVTEQADPRVGDALASKRDRGLELEHLLDAEGDRRPVAAGHAAIRVEDDVEALPPQRDGDSERALPLPFVPAGDD